MSYYVIGNNKCLYEGMTKEEILAAITEAVETHEITDVDTGFVTKLKEYNRNVQVTYWIGTQNEYDALQSIEPNRLYFISNDTFGADVATAIANANASIESMSNTLSSIQTATATSFVDTSYITGGTLTFYKNTSLVICNIDLQFKPETSTSYTERTILNFDGLKGIPEGYRPRSNVELSSAVSIYRADTYLSDCGIVKVSSAGMKLGYNGVQEEHTSWNAAGQIMYFV